MASSSILCSGCSALQSHLVWLPRQVRLASLRREEDGLGRERERLEAEKMRHIRRVDPLPPALHARRGMPEGCTAAMHTSLGCERAARLRACKP